MKIKPLFFFLISAQLVYSQEKESYYVFDENWKPTDVKTAKFMLRVQNVNDSLWQWDYYNMFGPLIKTEHYRSKDAKVLHGTVAYYDANGFLDSTGVYANGKKEGDFWKYREDSSRLTWVWKYVYHNDTLIETVDLIKKAARDSLDFSIMNDDDIESDYPGGNKGWQKYLLKKFKYPDRAINNNIEGEVRVMFVIDKEGTVEKEYLSKSVEYSLDEEALTIIRQSGKWTAGSHQGKTVKTYKQQPINFKLE